MIASHLFNRQVVFHLLSFFLSFFLCTDELTAEELKEWYLQGQPTYSHLPSWVGLPTASNGDGLSSPALPGWYIVENYIFKLFFISAIQFI